MIANAFLDHVLDAWYVRDVRPRMRGRTFLIRFADDVRDRLRTGR